MNVKKKSTSFLPSSMLLIAYVTGAEIQIIARVARSAVLMN